jgi:hypothetical protein
MVCWLDELGFFENLTARLDDVRDVDNLSVTSEYSWSWSCRYALHKKWVDARRDGERGERAARLNLLQS